MRHVLWINPECSPPAQLDGATFHAAWSGLGGTRIDQNRLRSVERIETDAGTIYLKRFFGIQLKNELKLRLLQSPRCKSQAMRERLVIQRLRNLDYRPPVVIACGEETSWGHEHRSFILTRALTGTPLADINAGDELIGDVAEHLGRIVHDGVFLPDLGLDHVYVAESGAYELLDFHNARFGPAPGRRELGRAVVRFFRSPGGPDLRAHGLLEPFVRRYLRAAGRDDAVRPVLELCERRLGR